MNAQWLVDVCIEIDNVIYLFTINVIANNTYYNSVKLKIIYSLIFLTFILFKLLTKVCNF